MLTGHGDMPDTPDDSTLPGQGPPGLADPEALRAFLSDHLMNDIMPFWLRHAVDEAGGLNTCLDDEGRLVSRDKWLWSQWRAVWVFSRLHRKVDASGRWLALADHVLSFCVEHGWDPSQRGWRLRVAGDGAPLAGCESLYVDAFAIYGLAEHYRATGSQRSASWARRTADAAIERLASPHDAIPHFPYPIPPGARVHGLPMMFSLVLWELGRALDEPRYRDAALALADEVFNDFYRPDRDVILERIAAGGGELPGPEGTAVVPGHAIECMWFQAHIAHGRGDRDRLAECFRLTRRHLELGWDDDHGGLRLAVDADGRAEVGWAHADTKLWWPHTEALYAVALAHEHTRADWCVSWFDQLADYSFNHYPHPQGEWRQKLDRRGRPITDVVALPVKDPFHLPRALLLTIGSLDRRAAANQNGDDR